MKGGGHYFFRLVDFFSMVEHSQQLVLADKHRVGFFYSVQ